MDEPPSPVHKHTGYKLPTYLLQVGGEFIFSMFISPVKIHILRAHLHTHIRPTSPTKNDFNIVINVCEFN